MKKLLFFTLLLPTLAQAQTVLTIKSNDLDKCSVVWTAPTLRVNGDALTLEEIESYTIYAGKEPGQYTKELLVEGRTSADCSEFGFTETGNYYFAGITTDTNGEHSALSNEISKAVKVYNPPRAFKFTIEGSITITE